MKIPTQARYLEVMLKANEFLREEKINSFPIMPTKIIKRHKWALVSYSELANIYKCSTKDICKSVKSKDAYTVFNGLNYTIAYNDKQSLKRIYFTLMHEIGHIKLGHLIQFPQLAYTSDKSNISSREYRILENEANSFARNVVSPITLVLELQMGLLDIETIFCISLPAAETRVKLRKSDYYWISAIDYDIQLNSLAGFYRQAFIYLKQQKNYFTPSCPLCSNENIIENTGLCLSCSLNNLPDFRDMYENYIEQKMIAGSTPPF